MHDMGCIVDAPPQARHGRALRFSLSSNVLQVSGGALFWLPRAPFDPTILQGTVIRPRARRGFSGEGLSLRARAMLVGAIRPYCLAFGGAALCTGAIARLPVAPSSFGALVAASPVTIGFLADFLTVFPVPFGASDFGPAVDPLPCALEVEPPVASAAPCVPLPLGNGIRLAGHRGKGGCGGRLFLLPLISCGVVLCNRPSASIRPDGRLPPSHPVSNVS